MTPRARSSAPSCDRRLTPPRTLERADGQVVLVLYEDLRAQQLVERAVAVERRRAQVRRDAKARLEHVGECRHMPIHERIRPWVITSCGETSTPTRSGRTSKARRRDSRPT